MECFVIFVMAWCWCNATESKPQNVVCNLCSTKRKKKTSLKNGLKKGCFNGNLKSNIYTFEKNIKIWVTNNKPN